MPEFVTKDSGERASFPTGMVRDTTKGKALFSLLFSKAIPYRAQLLTRMAELMARGAEKYSARNWEKARTQEELERFEDSALRHLIMHICGLRDEDHLAATGFNLMGIAQVDHFLAQEPTDEIGVRPEDVSYHHHGDPRLTFYMPEEKTEIWSPHDEMKPHRHEDDGRVIPL
jgi:hypothetical protein